MAWAMRLNVLIHFIKRSVREPIQTEFRKFIQQLPKDYWDSKRNWQIWWHLINFQLKLTVLMTCAMRLWVLIHFKKRSVIKPIQTRFRKNYTSTSEISMGYQTKSTDLMAFVLAIQFFVHFNNSSAQESVQNYFPKNNMQTIIQFIRISKNWIVLIAYMMAFMIVLQLLIYSKNNSVPEPLETCHQKKDILQFLLLFRITRTSRNRVPKEWCAKLQKICQHIKQNREYWWHSQ